MEAKERFSVDIEELLLMIVKDDGRDYGAEELYGRLQEYVKVCV